MLSIQKILVPVVLTETSRHVVHQAAWLARRFHAEMILLHVVTPLSYPAGVLESGHEITARDLHAHIVQRAQEGSRSGFGARARWDFGHTDAAQRRPGPGNREGGSRTERRSDRDVDPWPWHVLPLSAGLGDGEGAARKPLPGLDRRSPGRDSGARVLDPPHPLLGGFEPHSHHTACLGRRDSRGRPCDAYAGPHYGQCGDLRPRRIPTSTTRGRRRSSASLPKRSPSFSRTWVRRPKSSSIAAMCRNC